MIDQMRPLYGAEVDAMDLPASVDRCLFLWSCGVAPEIQKAGGLAIIAHPYWRQRSVVDLAASTYDTALPAVPVGSTGANRRIQNQIGDLYERAFDFAQKSVQAR